MTASAVDTAPTFAVIPDGDETTGQDCVDLAMAYGILLDPWQMDVIRGFLREADGGWAASQCGLVVARQSGKGQILAAVELFVLFALGETVLHTSHQVKTSSDAFRRLWSVVQSHPDLSCRVERHSQMIGAEYVTLDNGARISFSTRSASTGRGLSVDRLIVDEAEDFPAPEVGSLVPTVFARPRAQSMYVGTAATPMHDSEAFSNMRASAHDRLNARLCWFEWCAEWGSDIDDPRVWSRVNPAVATGRVPMQAIIDDRAVLPPDQFRAERLSMWLPKAAGSMVFDALQWEALTDLESVPVNELSIGVDAHPSRDAATVCLAGLRADGLLHVEWYMGGSGVTWLPPWINSHLGPKVRAVVVDERGVLAELDWQAVMVRPTPTGNRDMAVAAGLFWDAVTEGTLRHRGQVELTQGVLSAKQRPMLGGQAFGWDRKAVSSSILIAASLAIWGVTCERPQRPRRKPGGRIGTVM